MFGPEGKMGLRRSMRTSWGRERGVKEETRGLDDFKSSSFSYAFGGGWVESL
jgi:hypothetical protein